MKSIVIATVTAVLTTFAASHAFAEGKTRAQVYQELIEAQQNGLDYVTDGSYPDVNPFFASRVAQMTAERLAKQNAQPQTAATSEAASQPAMH